MTEEQVRELLRRLELGQCTADEEKLLLEWARQQEQSGMVHWTEEEKEQFKDIQARQILLSTGINVNEPVRRAIKPASQWWWAAAGILVLITAGSYFLFRPQPQNNQAKNILVQGDVLPGTNKAVLTLADGRQIILDSAVNGQIAQQTGSFVVKQDGQLIYHSDSSSNYLSGGVKERSTGVTYNTMSTPRGGQYQLILPDGSKVWLDAESSLRYPTTFSGKERTVELTGQGYFEVAKNPLRPFHVKTTTQDVTVLGTHFNINSYGDEEVVKTTLLEGVVRVIPRFARDDNNNGVIVRPGQEAQLNKGGAIGLIKNVDVEQAMAWKNGMFNFKSASLRSIMNQVIRWYDVEVIYEGNQSISLSGYVDRNVPLSQTLKLLESNGVRLRQEGKKIIMLQ